MKVLQTYPDPACFLCVPSLSHALKLSMTPMSLFTAFCFLLVSHGRESLGFSMGQVEQNTAEAKAQKMLNLPLDYVRIDFHI